MLASLNRRAENIRIEAIVVAELEFRNVQRHIFGADLVERADDAALEDRPEAFNRIRVDRADNVALRGMHHGLARVFVQPVIDWFSSVASKLTLLETISRTKFSAASLVTRVKRAGDHVALAADSADHWRFTGACAARFAVMLLIPMPVVRLCRQSTFRQPRQCRPA